MVSYIPHLAVVLFTVCVVMVMAREKFDPEDEHYGNGDHDQEYDHEAVLGSRRKNKQYGKLPPHLARKKLSALVDEMDSDKDGKISKTELAAWISQSFKDLNKEDALTKLRSIDTNRDYKITWEEYLEGVFGYKPEDIEKLKEKERKGKKTESFIKEVQEDKERFELADDDKDEKLSLTEYTHFLHPAEHPAMAEFELEKSLEHYDTNGDRLVSFQEYLGDSKPSKKVLKADQENFDQHDVDKDGSLNKQELRTWVVPHPTDTVDQEVEHLFGETDVDRNGELDKQEILDKYYFWVGSAVMDDGDEYHHDRDFDEL